MRELFIYYRIDARHSASALALVVAAQACLRERHPGLQARLLRRPETEQALQTWMEIYSFALTAPGADGQADVTADIEADVESDIEAELAVLAPLLSSARHAEVFIACA